MATTTTGKKNLLIDNKSYSDISLIGILKRLVHIHKINTFQYKEAIHRLKRGKAQKEAVKKLVFYYLHTIKSHSAKCTQKKITMQKSSGYKRIISLRVSGSNYAIRIKKFAYMAHYQNRYLSEHYKDLLALKIKNQFIQKLANFEVTPK